MNVIDADFMEIIRCPITRSKLSLQDDKLVSEIGGLRYPIRDGIPVLLPEEAELPEGCATLEEFKRQFVK